MSDRAQAPVLEIARAAGIPAVHVPPQSREANQAHDANRQSHDTAVLEAIRTHALEAPKFLVLAGYMRIVTPALLEPFRSDRGYFRVVNIHPSILPAFRGLNGYAQAFESGCQIAGSTVHLVVPELDAGPICAQASFSIDDCRSTEDRKKRARHRAPALFRNFRLDFNRAVFQIETHEGRARVRPN